MHIYGMLKVERIFVKKLFALLLIALSVTVALPSFGGLGPKKLPRKPMSAAQLAADAARKAVYRAGQISHTGPKVSPTAPKIGDGVLPQIPESLTNSLRKSITRAVTQGVSIPIAPIQVPNIQEIPSVDALTRRLELSFIPTQAFALQKTDALFEEIKTADDKIFEFYFITLPNLFLQPSDTPFVMRLEQVEQADRFYKDFLKRDNIYGEYENYDGRGPNGRFPLQESHIKWAEVLRAFTGLSVLGTQGAADAIVDATLLAPRQYRLITDYIAVHALLLLEDWPALQRFINVRSNSGHGGFPELRAYLGTVQTPVYFPKQLIGEDLAAGIYRYHYPSFRQRLTALAWSNLEGTYNITGFSEHIQGKKSLFYSIQENTVDKTVTPHQRVGNNNNLFLQCISYDAGITANMACIRAKLHRPTVYIPQELRGEK